MVTGKKGPKNLQSSPHHYYYYDYHLCWWWWFIVLNGLAKKVECNFNLYEYIFCVCLRKPSPIFIVFFWHGLDITKELIMYWCHLCDKPHDYCQPRLTHETRSGQIFVGIGTMSWVEDSSWTCANCMCTPIKNIYAIQAGDVAVTFQPSKEANTLFFLRIHKSDQFNMINVHSFWNK